MTNEKMSFEEYLNGYYNASEVWNMTQEEKDEVEFEYWEDVIMADEEVEFDDSDFEPIDFDALEENESDENYIVILY